MLSYNSNSSAIIQISLWKVDRDMQTSMQRLSSGLRINSAADDAAGLAISISMGARLKSENQAIRNANDAISAAQTADGALSTSSNIMQRLRTLAVQAATGTLSDSDRKALQAENDQLVSELDQVAKSARFNGMPLLDGSSSEMAFQVGPDSGDTISVPLASAQAANLGPKGDVSIPGNQVATASFQPSGNLTINGQDIAIGDGSAAALAGGINGAGIAGLTATAQATSLNLGAVSTSANADGSFSLPADLSINNDLSIAGFSWNPPAPTSVTSSDGVTSTTTNTSYSATQTTTTVTTTDVATSTVTGTSTTTTANTLFGTAIAAQINASSAGVTASYASGQLVLTASDGSNIEVKTAGSPLNKSSFSSFNTHAPNDITAIGALQLSATTPIDVTQGLSAAAGQGRNLPPGSYPLSLASTGLLLTQQGAADFIDVVDTSLGQISQMRSQLGSVQNVLGASVSVAQNTADNLDSSRSVILDADIATETANLARSRILQQAGIALLSQANQAPNSILSLLHSTFGG